MTTIKKHSVVTLHYTLKDEQGNVLDSSTEDHPLAYIHGTGSLIPGLELHLEGLAAGDSSFVSVAPEDGYGKREEQNVQEVSKREFGDTEGLEVGSQVWVSLPDQDIPAIVTAIEADTVTLDLNHPLAGKTLLFDVKIVEIREATEEELEHGHVHGPHGHHHH